MTSEEALLGIIPGPVYTERCGHGGYIATFECYPQGIFDLYVFFKLGQEVCLRYGENDDEYLSPGNIVHLIESSHIMPEYKRAVEILKSRGKFRWTPKLDIAQLVRARNF